MIAVASNIGTYSNPKFHNLPMNLVRLTVPVSFRA